jgi:hypothetical protein
MTDHYQGPSLAAGATHKRATIGQLTATEEQLAGLTCQACDRPATTTLELTHGTATQVTYRIAYYVCRQHVLATATSMLSQGRGLGDVAR